MAEKTMTIEEIDAHIEKLEQQKGIDICSTYKKVKPILGFVQGMLFFKPKWKKIIQTLVVALDKQCGSK